MGERRRPDPEGPRRRRVRRARVRHRRSGDEVPRHRGRAAARRLSRQGPRVPLQPPAAVQRARVSPRAARGHRRRGQRDGRHRKLRDPLRGQRGSDRGGPPRAVREGLRRPRVRGHRGRPRPRPVPRGARAHPRAPGRGRPGRRIVLAALDRPESSRAAEKGDAAARASCDSASSRRRGAWWPRAAAWSPSRWRRPGWSATATGSWRVGTGERLPDPLRQRGVRRGRPRGRVRRASRTGTACTSPRPADRGEPGGRVRGVGPGAAAPGSPHLRRGLGPPRQRRRGGPRPPRRRDRRQARPRPPRRAAPAVAGRGRSPRRVRDRAGARAGAGSPSPTRMS